MGSLEEFMFDFEQMARLRDAWQQLHLAVMHAIAAELEEPDPQRRSVHHERVDELHPREQRALIEYRRFCEANR